MIDFGRFYQQIATGPLASWLEVLPAQVAAWQRENLHGHFRNWEKSVDNLPLLVPQQLDLLHSVSAQHDALTARQRAGIEKLLRNLMPWRKGPFRSTAATSTQNGAPTGSGTACCRISLRWPVEQCWM